jgi:hypothetical protein
MKMLISLAFLACLSFPAFASDYNYMCQQRTDRTPINPSVGKISVFITHIKNLASGTEYRGEYADSVDLVKFVVRATKNGITTVISTTFVEAMSEDVMYQIENKGISFHLYLDEMEEAGLTMKINGKKKTVSLICE